MFKRTTVANALVTALFAGTMTAPVMAADTQDESTAKDVERIEVTGSRILREGAIAPSPVTVISGETLINTGAINIGEALNELPALASTYSLANSGRFIGTAGLNILDLRNMGTARTLVLVNGKRHVSSSAGTASVDTNTIPSTWVDRVEVITGGASAVYGADAVTGVVNFVLKKNIEGFNFSATRGYADETSYNNSKYSISYGQDIDDGRGNIAFSAEYSGQERLNRLDDPRLAQSNFSLANPDQTEENKDSPAFPDKIYTPNAGYYAINNAGAYSVLPQWWSQITNTFNSDGSHRPIYLGNTNIDGIKCADCDSFNLNQFSDLQPEFSRYNINLKANYDLTENLNAYFEAKYVNSQADDHGQPAFFFYDTDNVIHRDNPFLDESVTALMDENETDSLVVNRMMNDLGQRIENDTRETKRFVAGIEGTVLDNWDMEAFALFGQTDLERINRNNMIMANYFNALDAIRDENGNIRCRSNEAVADGCVPINIMGVRPQSQEARDYINTVSIGNSVIKQTVVGGSMTNSALYDLPAGSVGFAAGIEYRKEESVTEEPDNAEGTFFNVLGEDRGSFNVKEAFVEFSVPLLSDVTMVEDLTAEAAVRAADYSTIGNATSWKLGLDWVVNSQLRIRATQSEALRAPNISEIFGAPSQTFYNVDDACKASELDNLLDSQSATRRANCAAMGIPVDFDSSYDSATLEGLSGGNPDLKAEESTSTTIGFVYQPEFLEGFSMTVDYWKIELEDAISGLDSQDIIDRCVDSPTGIDNQYCALITRDPTSHEITLLKNFDLNIAGQEASGVDFEFGYDFELFGGNLTTTLLGTYLIERKDFPFQEEPENYEEFAGTTGEAEVQANLMMSYSKDNWFGTWKTRYLDSVSLYTDQELEDNPNPSNLMEYGTYFVSDMTAGYSFDNGVTMSLGIDNVFNRDLPWGTSGTGSGSASYDNIGRFFYATVSFKM